MKKQALRILGGLVLLAMVSAMTPASPEQNTSREFSLSAFPSMQGTAPLAPAAEYTVGIASLNGFSGRVALSCQPSSPGVSCMVSPSSVELNREIAESATVSAAAGRDAKPGAYQLTITGTTATGSNRSSTTVTLVVR